MSLTCPTFIKFLDDKDVFKLYTDKEYLDFRLLVLIPIKYVHFVQQFSSSGIINTSFYASVYERGLMFDTDQRDYLFEDGS